MVNSRESRRCRVLVTRPEGEAATTLCALLNESGYEVYHQPLLQIEGIPDLAPAQRDLLRGLNSYRHIIFISTNAVRFGMACVAEYWPQPPAGPCWYAVGTATARALAGSAIKAVTPRDEMSSEGLLALPGLQDVRDQRVLIVKGEGGRDTLRCELTQRGARVDELACYRRSAPCLPVGELAGKLARWSIEVALITSGESLANFVLLLSPMETSNLKHMVLIVPSERVARLAQEAGFDQVVTAGSASDSALLHALQQWSQRTGG